MKRVSIIYCKPCGYLKRAEAAATVIQKELDVPVSLLPGAGGIFEVCVDEEIVAKRIRGHFPETHEIVHAVATALSGDADCDR